MEDSLKKVRQFHDAMEVVTPAEVTLPPLSREGLTELVSIADEMHRLAERLHGAAQQHPQDSLVFLRLQLMQEELAEFAEALFLGDEGESLRELVDLRYVVDGSALAFGLGPFFQAGFDEVHKANMTKLDDNGKPCRDSAGRIRKGPNYEPPAFGRIFPRKGV